MKTNVKYDKEIYNKHLCEVTFERMHRFFNHCKKIEIPNPYSDYKVWDADNRLSKLHENAVPGIELISEPDTDMFPCELEVQFAKSNSTEKNDSFKFLTIIYV